MRLYIAAPSSMKAHMESIAAQFEAAGHTITERWWERDGYLGYDDPKFNHPSNWNALEEQATYDYLGVVDADRVVVINRELSEGKATEMGIALALLKPIILVGGRSRNVFHYMPSVTPVKDVEAAIRKLAA